MHSAEGEVSRLLTESELDSLEREIERWLDLSLKENPLLASFERDPDEPVGESRSFKTLYYTHLTIPTSDLE